MKVENSLLICRVTRKVLRISLIWPVENEEMNPGFWYYTQVTMFLMITSMWCVIIILHLIMSIKNNVDINLSEDVALTVAFTGLYIMIISYVRNQRLNCSLLKDLSNFENFGKPTGFDELNDKLDWYSKFFYGYTVLGIVAYNFFKFLEKTECERLNREKNLHEICGLLTPLWVPFEVNHFPVYHLLFAYEFISSQLLSKLALIISFNMLEICHHVILRIEHLKTMITECFDDDNKQIRKYKLGRCITYHKEILSLATRLDSCFSVGMLVHLAITGAICGCLENQMIKTNNKICALIHVVGWIGALFIACLGGQNLINASLSIPESIYSVKWYNVEVPLRRDVLFFLFRTQKTLHVSAGAFGFLSYPLFVSVMKMSYSILAALKA